MAGDLALSSSQSALFVNTQCTSVSSLKGTKSQNLSRTSCRRTQVTEGLAPRLQREGWPVPQLLARLRGGRSAGPTPPHAWSHWPGLGAEGACPSQEGALVVHRQEKLSFTPRSTFVKRLKGLYVAPKMPDLLQHSQRDEPRPPQGPCSGGRGAHSRDRRGCRASFLGHTTRKRCWNSMGRGSSAFVTER